MHPRITRLYVNNYRCFVNFELKPGRRSLLLGYNGSGKSSVFDVLSGIRDLVFANVDAKNAFPTDTVTKFSGSAEQRFELDVETEGGMLRYALLLAHDLEQKTAAIMLEELTFDAEPIYRFANGEVQLYGESDHLARGPFPFSSQRSFLASLEPKMARSPIASFKSFIHICWLLRLVPARIGASAPEEFAGLSTDAVDFASHCRFLLQETPDRMQRAHEALREIIPGFQHLRTQSAGRAKVLVARFQYPNGSPYDLDFDALSDGQKVLIVLYVVLHANASRIPVLCLDEPDNFVSIREIQPFLVELEKISGDTGLQVLLISHSAEVIDFIGAEDAILLERPDGAFTRVGSFSPDKSLPLSELMARGWHIAA
jgi:predicted ATPase